MNTAVRLLQLYVKSYRAKRGLNERLPYLIIFITFDVERVISSNEGSLMALAGSRGICVLGLPRRWGASGQFMQDKLKITCRIRASIVTYEVRDVHWTTRGHSKIVSY
uniref:Uncharacterized protein n=1 Tax=Glossina pallidipes TaxID=7398 RepID=A0A1A9ZES1_GLOPL